MKKTPLKTFSQKKAQQLAEYNKAKRAYFKVHTFCEFTDVSHDGYSTKPCRRVAVDIHHKMGRGPYTADPRYFMAVCRKHHDWIESNKKAARKRGYILYK